MRARITAHRRTGVLHWQAVLIDPTTHRAVWQDNSEDLESLAGRAQYIAEAFTTLARLGQTFTPWVDIGKEERSG